MTLKEEFHGEDSQDIPNNYEDYRVFVWSANADVGDDDWDVETWVTEGMDASPWGEHGTFTVEPASFRDIQPDELFFIRIMCHPETIGDPEKDRYWPASVRMYRELAAAYDAWDANEKAHGSLFDMVAS